MRATDPRTWPWPVILLLFGFYVIWRLVASVALEALEENIRREVGLEPKERGGHR